MKYFVYIVLISLFLACEGPKPRRAVKRNMSSANQMAIERSRKLLAAEENLIQAIIAKDSTKKYHQSTTGSWYYYNKKNSDNTAETAQPDDLVTMTYNISTLTNDTIYRMKDIGIFKYKVDKQELFIGLRNAVKLLKENETATFLFPSSLAYGVPGDGNKIDINMPLKATVAILKIEKERDSI